MPLFGSIPANQNVEVDPVWVQPGPPGSPDSGELWWDTDETASGITTPLGVTDGGTGATSPATARASLAVPSIGNSTTVAGAPTTGTWARGDSYLDSVGVVWVAVTAGSPGVWAKAAPGLLAYAEGQTGQTGIGGSAVVLTGSTTGSVTLTASRRVEMRGSACFSPSGAAAAAALIIEDSTSTYSNHTISTCSTAGWWITVECARIVTLPAGTYTFRMRAWAPSGTLNMYGNTYIYTKITDMGP